MTLLDLEAYISNVIPVFDDYEDRERGSRSLLVNIAMAGTSSDRTIDEYNNEILASYS